MARRRAPHADSATTLRQRGTVVLGWLLTVCCLVMLVLTARDGGLDLVGAGSLLFGAGFGWCVLARPSVRLDDVGVHVHNPLRQTTIPWPLLTDCTTRWNLRVYSGDVGVGAWAIPARTNRPRPVGNVVPGGLLGRRLEQDTKNDPAPTASISAQQAADLIERERETRLAGSLGRGAPVVRRWDPLDAALLGGSLLLTLVGVLT